MLIHLAWRQKVTLSFISCVQDSAEELEDVEVEQGDFLSSLASLTPSLSQDELARYAALQNKYEGIGR